MNITEVRVSPRHNSDEKLRAFASITIDASFVVRGLKIIRRGNGEFFVAMPNRETRNGDTQDICHPINQETRDQVERLVLEKFAEVTHADASNQNAVEDTECRTGDHSPNVSMISARRD